MLTTKQAATVLGISLRTVQVHITAGNLKAVKIGRDYLIEEAELERFKTEKRPAHRPRKKVPHETESTTEGHQLDDQDNHGNSL